MKIAATTHCVTPTMANQAIGTSGGKYLLLRYTTSKG